MYESRNFLRWKVIKKIFSLKMSNDKESDEQRFKTWNNLAGEDADFVVELDNCKLKCHKNVLKKYSCYFAALITSQMKESENNSVLLKGIEKENFLALCDFAYTERLNITEDNMLQIAGLSNMYQFRTALKIAEEFIISKLTSTTWLDIITFAEIHQLVNVFNKALRFILWYFLTEIENNFENVKQLPRAIFIKVLGHRCLNIPSELDVARCVNAWVTYNGNYNEDDTSELMKSVLYLGSCYMEDFHGMLRLDSVSKCRTLKHWIQEHLTELKSETSETAGHHSNHSVRTGPLSIICVGGAVKEMETTIPAEQIYQINPYTAEVNEITSLENVFSNFGTNMGYRACCVDSDLYLTGGEAVLGRNSWIMDVWKYSSFEESWSVVSTLNQPRRHHGLCVLDDEIYLIGGITKYRQITTSVEKYNPANDEWTCLSPLRCSEFWPAVTICDGEIFCIKNNKQKYNPLTDQWTLLTIQLPFDLGFHSAVSINNDLYMKCQYDPRVVRLRKTPDGSYSSETVFTFSSFSQNGQLLGLKNRIYCVGGENCKQLEYYDLRTNSIVTIGNVDLEITGFSLALLPHFILPL